MRWALPGRAPTPYGLALVLAGQPAAFLPMPERNGPAFLPPGDWWFGRNCSTSLDENPACERHQSRRFKRPAGSQGLRLPALAEDHLVRLQAQQCAAGPLGDAGQDCGRGPVQDACGHAHRDSSGAPRPSCEGHAGSTNASAKHSCPASMLVLGACCITDWDIWICVGVAGAHRKALLWKSEDANGIALSHACCGCREALWGTWHRS